MTRATKRSSQNLPLFLEESSPIFPEVSPTLLTSYLKPTLVLFLLVFFSVSACDLFPKEEEDKKGGDSSDQANQPSPSNSAAITGATYNSTNGQVVITGTGLPTNANHWDLTKLSFDVDGYYCFYSRALPIQSGQ